jgi:hypothetical protein
MKNVALTLAFLLELVAFIAFAALGYLLPTGGIVKLVAFVVLLVLVITFWSVYMAPRAPHKLKGVQYHGAKAIVYVLAAVAIFARETPFLAVLFLVAYAVDEVALRKHNLA